MKKLFALGNAWCAQATWKDLALLKFCLFAMGLFIGILLPLQFRGTVMVLAIAVFVITYIILMKGVYRVFKNMK